ncbi:MAG: hypothetical protein SFV51_28125 [Bryobacteraceae bacterium]|nr:hypothetical protein [Bryobacteraceae bacterium]
MTLLTGGAFGAETLLDVTFDRMYRHNFSGAVEAANTFIGQHPEDPLGYTVRASAHLFSELDRLQILESEFFGNNKRITDKRKPKPDLALKGAIFRSLEIARRLGRERLGVKPDDTNALFALCLAAGVETDYLALVEKRQFGSLTHAKESHAWAVKLLAIDPAFHDAHLTTGLSEYLLGSVPFFVRWFLKFEQAEGTKDAAVRNLQKVAASGRYLRPFAKVLLAIIHLREKRPAEVERLLGELSREFPENPLFRKELEKISRRKEAASGGTR